MPSWLTNHPQSHLAPSQPLRAYAKFLVNGGVSAVLDLISTHTAQRAGPLAGLLWWLRRLGKEPGSRGMKRLKVAILAGQLHPDRVTNASLAGILTELQRCVPVGPSSARGSSA